jgi:hypothetical protein
MGKRIYVPLDLYIKIFFLKINIGYKRSWQYIQEWMHMDNL